MHKPLTLTDAVLLNVQRLLDENRLNHRLPSTQAELANEMGVSRQGVANLLNPKGSLSLRTVERMAIALEVEAWELVRPPGTTAGHSLQDCLRELSREVGEIPRLRELAAKYLEHIAEERRKKKPT